jgi:endo-beta-N-acetylglucosaminidase D
MEKEAAENIIGLLTHYGYQGWYEIDEETKELILSKVAEEIEKFTAPLKQELTKTYMLWAEEQVGLE